MRSIGLATLASFFMLIPSVVFAVLIPTLQTPLEIEVVPQNPRPGETVFLRAVNAGSSATTVFVWSVNGRVFDQGAGVDTISLTAPAVGSSLIVEVSTSNGHRGSAETVIAPGEVVLVWEGNTSTVPFYIGRPTAGEGGTITATAVPLFSRGGARITESSLVFSWSLNTNRRPIREGVGLNTITFSPPPLSNEFTLTVSASTPDGTIRGEGRATIRLREPRVLVYEEHPLSGIRFGSPVNNRFVLQEDEVTFVAFPVGFPRPGGVVWQVNRAPVASGATPERLTLRRTAPGEGLYTVDAVFQSLGTLTQSVRHSFTLQF